MIRLDYEQLEDLAKNQLCAEHKTPVVVAWYSGESIWTLRCDEGHYPDALIRIPSLTEDYRQGRLGEGPIADNIKKGSKRRAMTNNKLSKEVVLGDVPRVDLATGELLLPEQVQAILHYATKYALDAYRGHVVVMYGKPYIGLDGYLYHANQSGKAYRLNSRPLTKDERPTYQIGEGDHAWVCEVIIGDDEQSFTGLGIVTKAEMEAKSPRDATKLRSPVVAKYPWQLAQKRAEWQGMRRAFPIGETEEVKED